MIENRRKWNVRRKLVVVVAEDEGGGYVATATDKYAQVYQTKRHASYLGAVGEISEWIWDNVAANARFEIERVKVGGK